MNRLWDESIVQFLFALFCFVQFNLINWLIPLIRQHKMNSRANNFVYIKSQCSSAYFKDRLILWQWPHYARFNYIERNNTLQDSLHFEIHELQLGRVVFFCWHLRRLSDKILHCLLLLNQNRDTFYQNNL